MNPDAMDISSYPSISLSLPQATPNPPIDAPNQRPFPFLSLPAELRLQIYTYLLYDPTAYIVPYSTFCPFRVRVQGSISLHPVILRLSKQIHAEAVSILYSKNLWMIRIFPLGRHGAEVTASIGVRNARLIRRVFSIAGPRTVSYMEMKNARQEDVWASFAKMGINGKELKFWGWLFRHEEAPSVEEGGMEFEEGSWMESVEGVEMEKYGVWKRWWSVDDGIDELDEMEEEEEEEKGETVPIRWAVMKGSVGVSEDV